MNKTHKRTHNRMKERRSRRIIKVALQMNSNVDSRGKI